MEFLISNSVFKIIIEFLEIKKNSIGNRKLNTKKIVRIRLPYLPGIVRQMLKVSLIHSRERSRGLSSGKASGYSSYNCSKTKKTPS